MSPIALALVAALALPAVARAADGSAGGLFAFIALTTDDRFEGQSISDGQPALQGNLHYWRPDGWYLGAFISQVDFRDPGHTRAELDWYGGRNLEFDGGRTELKLQLMDSTFLDNRTPGPTYDFMTYEAALKRGWTKTLSTSALLAFTPQGSYRSGEVWRVEADADYVLSPSITLKAQAGDQWGGRNHTRAYWSLGADWRWRDLGFELRYVGTDRTRTDCPFLPKTCDPAVVATVTAYLPPLMF